MRSPPQRTDAGLRADQRLESGLAALLSALLHLLLLALALSSPPVTMATPEGAASGSRVEVVMIGEAPESAQPPDELPLPVPVQPETPRPPDPAEPSPPTPPIQPTPVARADEFLPRKAAPPPPAAGAPPATGRRAHVWGQPPGMLPEDHAPVNAGPAPSPAIDRGRRHDASSSEPNLEVGGYQVLYDLLSESRLRAWRDQGMTELFIPLPGAREYMVCPLETALRRESGACRLLDPDDPEMADIGDAREVITMHRVYRRGELLWRGPRPYR